MEFGQEGSQKFDNSAPRWPFIVPRFKNTIKRIIQFAKTVKKIGDDDPRRIAHSFKVGFALTLVSIFYYVTPLFASFGVSTVWAVLTVVVVMEYTVGGTLIKGLNRAFATLLAGALGVAAHQIAVLCGDKGEPVLLGLFVFVLAAAATFSRFIPEVKAKYDYGVMIFILTFSLVAVSSYRVDELIELAHQRLSTIAFGVATCLGTSIFVFPVWAGEDLHKLVADNLEKLAYFLEGLAAEYFAEKGATEDMDGKSFLKVYMSVLNSKPTEDFLANLARWEPRHGRFLFRHPWSQYQTIGVLSRQCAYLMDALATFITTLPKHKPNMDQDRHLMIQTACGEVSSESAKALKELSLAILTMTTPTLANHHASNAVAAMENLKDALSKEINILPNDLHMATTASFLDLLVIRIQGITSSVEELARLAHFRRLEPVRDAKIKPIADGEDVIIDLEK